MMHGNYQLLLAVLAGLPPQQQALTLSVAELVRLRSSPLPAAARTPGYWTGTLALRTWERLGFHARLAPDGASVTFIRHGPACGPCQHGELASDAG